MSSAPRKPAEAQAPPELTDRLQVSAPASAAAGFTGVAVAVQHVLREMGAGRAARALFSLNQQGGVDCPGCAWPDPDDERSRLGEYCENGAKAIAEESTEKRLTPDFFAAHSVSEMALWDDFTMGKKGRIAQPMWLPPGADHYVPIAWDQALEKVAVGLRGLASPHEAIFYTSGRTSNEAAFLYQLLVRSFGTNNLPDCSNMCHESSGVALGESLGIGKGSVKLEDFEQAEVILIAGQNPGTNHPRMLSALQKAHRRGAKIVAINPLIEPGLVAFKNPQEVGGMLGRETPLADLYLQVRVGGDLALFQAVAQILLQDDETVWDESFIRTSTQGFDAWRTHVLAQDFATLVVESGLTHSEIEAFASLLCDKRRIIACWAMGITQHREAVATIQEMVNLLLAKGSIGKPGAGTCPVRGHSNVQGDRTMGIFEKPPASLLDALKRHYHVDMPREHGHDVVDSIHAMHEGRAQVFFAMGGNFLSATPDTEYTAAALRNCALTVQVSTKLNRSHLVTGQEALILPCLARTDRDFTSGVEQFVTTENSMGVIQSSRGNLQPVSDQLLSEPAIVCLLGLALFGEDHAVPWRQYLSHYGHIRSAIEQVIPGFDRYNERVQEKGGFYLPNSARIGDFPTSTGKANFTCSQVEPVRLPAGSLIMMTLRSHDQFNTTIYGLDDRYRGIRQERRVVLMNPDDMTDLGLAEREPLDLLNATGGVVRVAENFLALPYAVPRGCCATYFPEANVLVPITSVAKKSNTPMSKFVPISVRKRQGNQP